MQPFDIWEKYLGEEGAESLRAHNKKVIEENKISSMPVFGEQRPTPPMPEKQWPPISKPQAAANSLRKLEYGELPPQPPRGGFSQYSVDNTNNPVSNNKPQIKTYGARLPMSSATNNINNNLSNSQSPLAKPTIGQSRAQVPSLGNQSGYGATKPLLPPLPPPAPLRSGLQQPRPATPPIGYPNARPLSPQMGQKPPEPPSRPPQRIPANGRGNNNNFNGNLNNNNNKNSNYQKINNINCAGNSRPPIVPPLPPPRGFNPPPPMSNKREPTFTTPSASLTRPPLPLKITSPPSIPQLSYANAALNDELIKIVEGMANRLDDMNRKVNGTTDPF